MTKVFKKLMNGGSGWIDTRSYNQARKGIEMISNALFELQNVAVDDPNKDEKRAKYDEFRQHFIAIRELLEEIR